ncbi:protein TPR1-like isoform X1 [Cucumis melo var. makuwa]|uniref:Protein TPR1-like isoform X1 n=1 Tax=Cucumis melo var. makuwa TaxID=1194695 RepID=A0A5A7VE79_CUCMM|nr:protein TPR1-like isoform X1 [Cucumis melo var. makuwa]
MATDPDPDRALLFLILQFLDHQNLSETARSLECETGLFFNMTYFEELLNCCAYNEAESYLCGFTDIHDNIYSTKIYFGIRKLKFLEALADGEREVAREVVEKDIEIFDQYNPGLVQQAFELLQMDNFMQVFKFLIIFSLPNLKLRIWSHILLSSYKNMKEARKVVMENIKKCIEANPLLQGKLSFPPLSTTLQAFYMEAMASRGRAPATCRRDFKD